MYVAAINVWRRFALTDCGVVCPITNLIDSDGDDTDDPSVAKAAIVHLPNGMWAVVSILDYDQPMQVH